MTVGIFIFNPIHLNIYLQKPLNFFSEEKKIEDCIINSKWMNKTLGLRVFEQLEKRNILFVVVL